VPRYQPVPARKKVRSTRIASPPLAFLAIFGRIYPQGVAMAMRRGDGALFFFVTASLAAQSSGLARADEELRDSEAKVKMPVAYSQRPLTNPAFTLSPDVGFDVSQLGSLSGVTASSPTIVSLVLSTSMSFTDDLAVRVTFLPLELSPQVHYGTSSLVNPFLLIGPGGGVTFRFVKRTVEIAASFDFAVSTLSGVQSVGLVPGIPILFHLGKNARLDTGVNFPILTGSSSTESFNGLTITTSTPTIVMVKAPLSVYVNVIDPLYFGVRTGFEMALAGTGATPIAETAEVPLGFVMGCSVPGPRGPLLDFVPFFVWPAFVNGSGNRTVDVADFDFGLDAIAYIFL
jgi:hypothetical protein